jgi:hypothetical protein
LQFLELQNPELVVLLLEKHQIDSVTVENAQSYGFGILTELVRALDAASEEAIRSLVGEIARTIGGLRSRVSPKYTYDERFEDLQRCAYLDGYVFENQKVIPVDPTIVGIAPLEDDLTKILDSSKLGGAADVIGKLNDSASSFRSDPPNFNATLNDARVALQILATQIALQLQMRHGGNFEKTKWGSVISYLLKIGFITTEEERGLVGVFGFVSPGSHRAVGFSDREMARLGRSFAAGMCYFLAKRYLVESS